MASLEQPFLDAINGKKIDSAIILGKNVSGSFNYSKVFGDRTLLDGTKKPLAPSDLLFLASTTKILSTVAALQCVERGQLSLKGPAEEICPELGKLGVIKGFDDNGEAIIEPAKKKITLEHLITHSSGLAYPFMAPQLMKWREKHPKPESTPTVPDRDAIPLIFEPGEGWMYGSGLDWAGHMVEKVSDLSLEEYFQQHLLAPLGLDASNVYFWPQRAGAGDRMVDLNPNDPKGQGLSVLGGTVVHPVESEKGAFGGDGGYATAPAILAVLHSVLANDEKILSKQTVKDMHKPHLEEGAKKGLDEALAHPQWGVFIANGTSGKGRDYGLGGLYVGEDGDGGLGKGTLIWGGGVNSAWIIDPKNDICGFAAPQLGYPPDPMLAMVLKQTFRREIHTVYKEAKASS